MDQMAIAVQETATCGLEQLQAWLDYDVVGTATYTTYPCSPTSRKA